MTVEPNASLLRDGGPAVERAIVFDMLRRSVWVVPVLLIVGSVAGGAKGAASTAFAIGVVVLNFVLSASMLSWAAKVSFAVLGAAALFGFLLRLGLITVAVLSVHDQAWVSIVILGIMLVVTHLALLLWELRYVSLSFSEPGVRARVRTVPPVNPAPVKE
jgi:hypothetical protein